MPSCPTRDLSKAIDAISVSIVVPSSAEQRRIYQGVTLGTQPRNEGVSRPAAIAELQWRGSGEVGRCG
jgi:hypothetical protein